MTLVATASHRSSSRRNARVSGSSTASFTSADVSAYNTPIWSATLAALLVQRTRAGIRHRSRRATDLAQHLVQVAACGQGAAIRHQLSDRWRQGIGAGGVAHTPTVARHGRQDQGPRRRVREVPLEDASQDGLYRGGRPPEARVWATGVLTPGRADYATGSVRVRWSRRCRARLVPSETVALTARAMSCTRRAGSSTGRAAGGVLSAWVVGDLASGSRKLAIGSIPRSLVTEASG